MKNALFITALSLIVASASAQKLEFSGLTFFAGSGSMKSPSLSQSDINSFRQMIPLPSDYMNNQYPNFATENSGYKTELGIMGTFNVRNAHRKGWVQQLRVGLSYGNFSMGTFGHYQERGSVRIDTLISQRDGSLLYVDSTYNKNAYYSIQGDMISIHLNYLLHYKPQNKLSFYTGVGLSLGSTIDNELQLTRSSHGQGYGSYFQNGPGIFSEHEFKVQNIEVDGSTALSAYIPLGLNYRLSKKANWLKKVSLNLEYRPGLMLQSQSKLGSDLSFFSSGIAGLKFSF